MIHKRIISAAVAAIVLVGGITAGQAQAACMVEYKAKRDSPLALFYEVAEVPGPCTPGNAAAQLQASLAAQGLTLLKILSVTES